MTADPAAMAAQMFGSEAVTVLNTPDDVDQDVARLGDPETWNAGDFHRWERPASGPVRPRRRRTARPAHGGPS
jgi:hypothetical protein